MELSSRRNRFSPSRKEEETTSETGSINMENNFKGFRFYQKARITRLIIKYKKKNTKKISIVSSFMKKRRVEIFSDFFLHQTKK